MKHFFSSDVCPWPLECICDGWCRGPSSPSLPVGCALSQASCCANPQASGIAPVRGGFLLGSSPRCLSSNHWLTLGLFLLGDSASLEVLPSHFHRWGRKGLPRGRSRSNENPFILLILASASSRGKNYYNRAHGYGNYCGKKLETHHTSSLLEGPIS